MAKKQIKLVSNKGQEKPFDFDHAENLLRLVESKKNKSWKIAEPNKFQFIDGELRQNTSTSSSEKSDGKSGNEGKKRQSKDKS